MPEDLHEVGCVSRLVENGEVSRRHRARAGRGTCGASASRNIRASAPYLRAHLRIAARRDGGFRRIAGHVAQRAQAIRGNRQDVPALSDQVKIAALNTEHPGHFADLIAANLNLSLEDRQKLLETISVRERLQKLLPMLNREQEVLTLSSKIQNDVASSIAKTQRDFFLREQMRAIQRELGEGEPGARRNQVAARKNRADADARRGAQGRRCRNWNASSRRRPPPPNTPSRAITSTGF